MQGGARRYSVRGAAQSGSRNPSLANTLGSSLLSVGERFWKERHDTSGTGMSIQWLSIWRTQCPTPSAILNESEGLFGWSNSAPKSSPMFGSLSLKNRVCLQGPPGPPITSRSASEPRECRHRSGQKQRPAPLWARPGSPGPPGPSLSLEGTAGARNASLPPGSISPLPPGAKAPLALCETSAAFCNEPQISRHRISS
jgi:hypothetical protein